METVGSWDALGWTKIEAYTRSVAHGMDEFLLPKEDVIAEGHGVVMVNTDVAGTLLVTNFRLLFVGEGPRKLIPLGTIPLATIEKFSKQVARVTPVSRQGDRIYSHQGEKIPSRRLLQVIGKDMRIILFGFRPRTKQRRAIFDGLTRYMRPSRLWDLYAFTCGAQVFTNSDPKVRLHHEYLRLLGKNNFLRSVTSFHKEKMYLVSNKSWRITDVNSNYKLCPTYPHLFLAPSNISDEELSQAATFRARGRLPVVTWCHPENGAVLARSSQPLVGLMMNSRSNADEKLVAALRAQIPGSKYEKRKLYIADARPRKNAIANGAKGGGSESKSNYSQSEVVFLGIDNIHAMRESFNRLRDYLDTHGATSSDGLSSFLRNNVGTWAGGSQSSMSASVSALGDSGWLMHIHSVLAGSAWIAALVAVEAASVLVHCSDGWDRTTQLISLASLLLDPYYRTFDGFQALVEKDWLAFGHPFADRLGMPTICGNLNTTDSFYHGAAGGNASPLRVAPGTAFTPSNPQSPASISSNYSPIFLQWVDCVAQLLRIYPRAFEFSSDFLVEFVDCYMSCRFGNFLCNSEKERQQAQVADSCGCIWAYLTHLRISGGRNHEHYNLFYDHDQHPGSLLPPAAALAPSLWSQFHLRWACPSEAQGGELEAQCHLMAQNHIKLQEAKTLSDEKIKDLETHLQAMNEKLKSQARACRSAAVLAKRACQENTAIKRAMDSIGCKVHISSTNGGVRDIESLEEIKQYTINMLQNDLDRENIDDHQEQSLSVSVSVVADTDCAANLFRKSGDGFCPFRAGESCKWPDVECAQKGSQFTGLRANYDAFEQLYIQDCYFKSDHKET
ncbi:phosphatidylinositol-3-phosphatase myotubularin-1 isoform X1 [Cryptomeria japonica]|uniref:phosphatidylinositol-3-phosphatase myotubularin-1 isoform X1 n=1 Tax=Cryptomeria japonica TaxID=3369 RepID=UPI0027D9D595|nr:phosphatidylinositol-3-phosphatase myotubularin-1 isoform X1 [Cryptomeria japonica]XP_057859472.2 phosphatidylinositol-3-phosphatase myotubularin-1 isoform X1 [Cryptomeria japonica]